MKVTLESTAKIVQLNGVPARIWQGHTDSGASVHAYVTRIACDANDIDTITAFERELQATAPPRTELAAIPLRMIL